MLWSQGQVVEPECMLWTKSLVVLDLEPKWWRLSLSGGARVYAVEPGP